MKGLNIFTSNCIETLGEELARIVREPLPSPLSPEIIVVQSKGMERWVSMALAEHNGICANCFFPFPNTFLQEMFKKVFPDLPDDSPFHPDTMTFRVMKILPEYIHLKGFESLKRYLIDGNKGVKLFQISQKIADLFDQYFVFRPEMIFNWENGRDHHWQAHLWRELSSGKENWHRAELRKSFLEKIRKFPDQTRDFPSRVSIFGISYLPAFHFEVFIEMSKHCLVNLFLMNPCKEYWGDIVSQRETEKIRKKYARPNDISVDLYLEEGNRLLASMGTMGRNFFSMISELNCRMVEVFVDKDDHTILNKIQSDILNLKNRRFSQPSIPHTKPTIFDSSIQIHSCHSPMREIEVLHDNLLAMFEKDPNLLPKDIVVMTPDIQLYAPYIQAVFGAQTDEKIRIPFTVADRSIMKESPVVEGFMSILDLKNSRMGSNRIMALLEQPGIKGKFDITESEVEILERWVVETNIRWGIDAEYRYKLGLPAFSENTWSAGIKRLLLGYAMPGFGSDTFSGILPYDHIEGGEVKTLGKFINFLDRLLNTMQSLDKVRTLSSWNTVLVDIVEQFFASGEDSEREIQMLKRILDELTEKETLSGFDKPVEMEIVRSFLRCILEREQFRGGFISGGVTFCAMLPMRSIPFNVVCLLGMNTDAFPRETNSIEFDLMARDPRIGDRSKRNDDKYLFLEALLAARNIFYISYVGQGIQDNSRIPPSVLVSELIDYIKEGFGFSEEQVVILHKLQAFSPEYFKKGGNLISYSLENFIASSKIYDRREATPFISEKLSEPHNELKNLTIKAFSEFFGNPAKFLLEKRLGIYLPEATGLPDERENFRLDHLGRYLMDQDLMAKKFSGSDLKDFYTVKKASGELPHGKVGKCIYNEMSLDVEDFVRKINGHKKGMHLEDRDVDIDLEGFRVSGCISDIYENGIIKIIFANTKPKYLLSTWISHLIYCYSFSDKHPRQTFLLCKDSAWEFEFVPRALEILKHLLQLYWKGMSTPLHFFPESSFEYASKMQQKNQTQQAASKAAERKWKGSDFARGESEDSYFKLCFEKYDPLDEEFEKTSAEIFLPLLSHCNEIVLYEWR